VGGQPRDLMLSQ